MGSNTTSHWEDDPKRRWLFIIDVIGVCDLRCPSCPVDSYNEIKQPSEMMEPSLLDAILRKVTGECRGRLAWETVRQVGRDLIRKAE